MVDVLVDPFAGAQALKRQGRRAQDFAGDGILNQYDALELVPLPFLRELEREFGLVGMARFDSGHDLQAADHGGVPQSAA